MIKKLKKKVKRFIPDKIFNSYEKKILQMRSTKELKEWANNGFQVPPPHAYKRNVISEFQEKYNINTLIETGTYAGHMVLSQMSCFENIISIELSDDLYKKAKKKFKGYSNIWIKHGDSGKILPFIVDKLNEPAIFWLDGHYSAGVTARGKNDTPILKEIEAILNAKILPHVILIDDARHFTGNGDYPTIDELKKEILNKRKFYRINVKNDIIQCLPNQKLGD